jgi:uncharacterized protein
LRRVRYNAPLVAGPAAVEGVREMRYWLPFALLTISNVFMTFAWYGHLKYTKVPIVLAVLASWGIAFLEYCFQVPANRIGSVVYSAAELKTGQEIITLVVFSIFSVFYLNQPIRWNHLVGFTLMIVAAGFIFKKW